MHQSFNGWCTIYKGFDPLKNIFLYQLCGFRKADHVTIHLFAILLESQIFHFHPHKSGFLWLLDSLSGQDVSFSSSAAVSYDTFFLTEKRDIREKQTKRYHEKSYPQFFIFRLFFVYKNFLFQHYA